MNILQDEYTLKLPANHAISQINPQIVKAFLGTIFNLTLIRLIFKTKPFTQLLRTKIKAIINEMSLNLIEINLN